MISDLCLRISEISETIIPNFEIISVLSVVCYSLFVRGQSSVVHRLWCMPHPVFLMVEMLAIVLSKARPVGLHLTDGAQRKILPHRPGNG